MTCPCCGDLGMIRVPWSDAPDDYAICLCSVGFDLRCETNAGKAVGYALWQVWAARNQVQPSRIFLMEEVLTPAELAERGFHGGGLQAQDQDREAALLAAGRSKRGKL